MHTHPQSEPLVAEVSTRFVVDVGLAFYFDGWLEQVPGEAPASHVSPLSLGPNHRVTRRPTTEHGTHLLVIRWAANPGQATTYFSLH